MSEPETTVVHADWECPICQGDPALSCERCEGYSQYLIDLDEEDGEFD